MAMARHPDAKLKPGQSWVLELRKTHEVFLSRAWKDKVSVVALKGSVGEGSGRQSLAEEYSLKTGEERILARALLNFCLFKHVF